LQALKAQGISRDSLPYKTFWQPFCAYYALCGTLIMAFVSGYTVFLPGKWDTTTFFFSYTMIGLVPLLFIFWKVIARTQVRYEGSSCALTNFIQSGEDLKISRFLRQKE
jgi:amino acid transporter